MEKEGSKIEGWKILFRYLLRYKREIVMLSILGTVAGFSNATVPFLVGKFFDSILSTESVFIFAGLEIPLWVLIIVMWFVIQIVANISSWILDMRSRRLATNITATYPAEAVSHLLTLPLSFHKEHKHGETWDKIVRAGNYLTNITDRVVINLAPQFIAVFVGVGFAFYINTLLAYILVGGIILYVITLAIVVPPIVKYQKEGHKAWSEAYGDAYDAIANFQTVKQATAEDYERTHVHQKFLGSAFKLWYKVERIWTMINFYQRTIVILTQLAIFTLSVFLINQESMSIGDLIAVNGYALIVFTPFVSLGSNWQVIQNGVIAIERAEKILKMKGEAEVANGKEQVREVMGDVKFENVHFSYKEGEDTVLKGVDFSVSRGEVVAFVGESGVGKSTTIELISGYYFPQKGNVFVDGKNTKDVDVISLRKHISVVPQEVVLFNDTIEMNIKYGKEKTPMAKVIDAAEKSHSNIFIEKFPERYKQLVGERGIKLSVGQKQRIAIARAILRDPKILILDEPTSALDAKTEKFIQESLDELMRGRTTFIIAHRLSTVRRADKIFVFEKGKIVESGRHSELIKIKDGVYKKLYDLHIGLD